MANDLAARLRARLDPSRPALAMAAHNAISAKLAAEAGFDAIWGSGFELSAAHAVPDASILSWDTHLAAMRAMVEAQPAPVIADIDTGQGNAVNVAYLVPRYAAAGVAAVVMEDKTFPKDSSLRPGGRQELVPIAEFQGKIEAARIAGGPLVIARTEALIAGLGQNEALKRGAASAFADTAATFEAAASFAASAFAVTAAALDVAAAFAEVAALGKVGLIICGNHAIRAAVAAMRRCFARIIADGGIAGVEGSIASVADIFALQGDGAMREIEKRYLR